MPASANCNVAVADALDVLRQRAHAQLPAVPLGERRDDVVADVHVVGADPALSERVGHQVALGDLQLLVLVVAVEADHVQPVAQHGVDGRFVVGGAHEQHTVQVHGEVQSAKRWSCDGSRISSSTCDESEWRTA